MPHRPALLTFLLSVIVCLAPSVAHAADTVDLIVRRDAGLSASERADIRADAGVELERRLRVTDTELVTVPADGAADALQQLNADPDVRWATRDGEVEATAFTGGDPYWNYLWGLRNTGQTLRVGTTDYPGIGDVDMDVPEAWTRTTGAGVTVAVVDSGIQLDHPDPVRAGHAQPPLEGLAQGGGEGELSARARTALADLGWDADPVSSGRHDERHVGRPASPPPPGQGEAQSPVDDSHAWERVAHERADANRDRPSKL
jgi:hypothetical protein